MPEEYLLRGDYLRRRILKDAARTGVMVERADLDQLALLSDDLLDADLWLARVSGPFPR